MLILITANFTALDTFVASTQNSMSESRAQNTIPLDQEWMTQIKMTLSHDRDITRPYTSAKRFPRTRLTAWQWRMDLIPCSDATNPRLLYSLDDLYSMLPTKLPTDHSTTSTEHIYFRDYEVCQEKLIAWMIYRQANNNVGNRRKISRQQEWQKYYQW